MRFRKTAIAIIVNDNKILFIKRDNIPTIAEPDKWQLPGGHLEEGETPIKALKRELVEEVSYSPKKIHYIGSLKNKVREVSIFWSYVDKNEAEDALAQVKETAPMQTKDSQKNINEETNPLRQSSSEASKITIKMIIKTDTAGSLEALEKELMKLKDEEAAIELLKGGVGNINEDDARFS
ncbi:MAG: NUDIX hydrolase, partial [Candidatus Woesebacteria bacterium GW2011_GWA1_37_8]